MALRVPQGKPIPITTSAVGGKVLNVPHHEQENTQWCWAACCEMVFIHYNVTNVSQCDMASYLFGADCCAASGSSACNQPAWPDDIYSYWGFSFQRTNQYLSFTDVQREVDACRLIGRRAE